MKPEFTEVLLPPGKVKQPTSSSTTTETETTQQHLIHNVSCFRQFFIHIFTVVVVLIMTGIMVSVIVRYESKFANYENRISALENELVIFFDQLEKVQQESTPTDFLTDISTDDTGSYEYDNESDEDRLNEAEVEKVVFGQLRSEGRAKRQIPIYQGPIIGSNIERSKDGVAIVEGAYGKEMKSVNPTESEGLRLYESLITTGGQGEPKAPEFAESEGSNVQPYHRTSAVWNEEGQGQQGSSSIQPRRRLEVKSGDNLQNSGNIMRLTDNPMYTRTSSSPFSHHYSGALASSRRQTSEVSNLNERQQIPNVIIRNSRVPVTGSGDQVYHNRNPQHRSSYPYPPLKKIGQGDGEVIARVHQERTDTDHEEDDPEEAYARAAHGETSSFAVSRSYKGGLTRQSLDRSREPSPRRYPNREGKESDAEELNIVQAEAWAEGPKTITAHYVADASNYSMSHRHYEGNGRLKNADGIFSSWKPSDWMAGTDGSKEFSLSSTGVLTIKKDGIYYVYAQIHYLDDHDINGFIIQVNTESFLQCTRMTETVLGSTTKSNSCFTAGINHLKENDRILIRDIETNRYSIIKPEKSFFGLMRIGDSGRR